MDHDLSVQNSFLPFIRRRVRHEDPWSVIVPVSLEHSVMLRSFSAPWLEMCMQEHARAEKLCDQPEVAQIGREEAESWHGRNLL